MLLQKGRNLGKLVRLDIVFLQLAQRAQCDQVAKGQAVPVPEPARWVFMRRNEDVFTKPALNRRGRQANNTRCFTNAESGNDVVHVHEYSPSDAAENRPFGGTVV